MVLVALLSCCSNKPTNLPSCHNHHVGPKEIDILVKKIFVDVPTHDERTIGYPRKTEDHWQARSTVWSRCLTQRVRRQTFGRYRHLGACLCVSVRMSNVRLQCSNHTPQKYISKHSFCMSSCVCVCFHWIWKWVDRRRGKSVPSIQWNLKRVFTKLKINFNQ